MRLLDVLSRLLPGRWSRRSAPDPGRGRAILATHAPAQPHGNADAYANLLRRLQEAGEPYEIAIRRLVGGNYDAFGKIEKSLLVQYGLAPHHTVVDVGCGSGRLASALAGFLTGAYVGIDVLPDAIEYARVRANRPDWRFEVTDGLRIPQPDETADFVCFFSVLTHVPHEEAFAYLREARRALVPGGRVVMSFIEYRFPTHWSAFEATVAEIGMGLPRNVFICRDAIEEWACHLDLVVRDIVDGEKPVVVLDEPVVLDTGEVIKGLGALGQSICVLEKPR